MSESLNSVRLIGKYWGTVGLLTAARAQQALNNVELEAYTFQKFALDVLGIYNDSIGTYLSIIGNPSNIDLAPTLALSAPLGTNNVNGTLALGLPTTVTVNPPPGGLVTSGAVPIPFGSITLSVNGTGDLVVQLNNLNGVVAKGFFYVGPASVGGMVIASIQLHVT